MGGILDPSIDITPRWPYQQRSSTNDVRGPFSQDVMLTKDDVGLWARTRPGFINDSSISIPGGTPGGITYFNGFTYAVVNQNFYQVAGGPTGADGSTWNTPSASSGWAGRSFFDVVNFNNTLFLIGGNVNATGVAQADVWASKDGGVTWGQVTASAPFGARYGHRCVVFNGAIYLMGGYYSGFGGVLANDVWMTEDGANWVQVNGGASWGVRAYFGAVATSGGIYVMGGTDCPSLTLGIAGFTVYNDVWFSTDGITWTQVSAAAGAGWTARAGFDVVWDSVHNVMVLVGGVNPNTLVRNNQCWISSNGITWVQAAVNALGIGANVCVRLLAYGGAVYALGGHTVADSAVVYVSVDAGGTWTFAGNLPSAVSAGAVCVGPVNVGQSPGRWPTMFYIAGGGFVSGSSNNQTWNATLDVTFTNAALPNSVAGDAYQFETMKAGTCLLIKSINGLWLFEAGVITEVTDARYPPQTVPGIVVMGGFCYVMDPTGLIVNCDFENPTYWPGQNFIGADYSGDGGVAIAKESNYLIAFGPSSCQWFYDAGTPVGSPLLPYLAANSRCGCVDGLSVQNINGNLIWLGQDESGRRGIMMFNSTVGKIISPDAFNRLLSLFSGQRYSSLSLPVNAQALAISSETRAFYVYPMEAFPTGSIVYDATIGEWYLWTAGTTSSSSFTSAFPFACATSINPSNPTLSPPSGALCYMLPIFSGQVMYLSETSCQDQEFNVPFNIPAQVTTGLYDGGNNRMKFWGRLDLIADQSRFAGDVINVQVTDDDYNSFSPARAFDCTSVRPALFGWGASRKRAYKFTWNTPGELVRVRLLQQEYSQGT